MQAALAPLLVAGRIERIRDTCIGRGLDGIVLTDPLDIRWLTGFSGSAGVLVVGLHDATLITDGRYASQAREQISMSAATVAVIDVRTNSEIIATMVRRIGSCLRVGVDVDRITARMYEHVRSVDVEIADAGDLVAEARRVKDAAELERIERACRAADQALDVVTPLFMSASVMSERDIRDELEYRMRQFGADGPSYDTIVAAGENAAFPHHRPTSRLVREGDCVLIDVGAVVDGYHSDMTRTFLVGAVSAELQRMYDAVSAVQNEAVRSIREGVTGESVDEQCRHLFGADAEIFLHGTGHGVGLNIHESPWLRKGWNRPLLASEVVTVEPGLYRVGLGGVRIEDLVVVEPTSCRTLTLSPKDPQCLR